MKTGAVAAVAAGLPLKAALSAMAQGVAPGVIDLNPAESSTEIVYDPLAYYTQNAFTSYLNSTFRLRGPNGEVIDTTLSRVTDLIPKEQRPTAIVGSECFSLVFDAVSDAPFPQGTYYVEHAALGSFQLLLVPGGADADSNQSFVAIVNRLPSSPNLIPGSTSTKKKRKLTPMDTPVPVGGPSIQTGAGTKSDPVRTVGNSWRRFLSY